jgi:Scaffold protein Nfu/NifU N terminal
MGQPVAVVEKPSTSPGIVRFEANRTLTGMGHERFASADDATGPRPAAELARRLFATGKVAGVHIYANVITVDLAGDHTGASDTGGLGDVVRDLHKYWMPGMEPPAFEEPAEEEAGDAAAASADTASSDVGPELSEAAKRVPPDLLERSRLARERWKAKQG